MRQAPTFAPYVQAETWDNNMKQVIEKTNSNFKILWFQVRLGNMIYKSFFLDKQKRIEIKVIKK